MLGWAAVLPRLAHDLLRSLTRHQLIAPLDHVLVGLAQGMASRAMLDLLVQARHRAPVPFQICAVHVGETKGPAADALLDWARRLAPTEFAPAGEPAASPPLATLIAAAARLGCNKIALGHHREDALRALLEGLCRRGELRALAASEPAGPVSLIRPLIECAAEDLRAYADERGHSAAVPTPVDAAAGPADVLDAVIDALALGAKDVRAVMLNALQNVAPDHLLDPEVAAAWQARPHPDRATWERPAPSWRRALRVLNH